MMFESLKQYSGQADRELGTRKIDGVEASGFQLDVKKIDPDAYSGRVEIWLDSRTDLPVLVQYEFESANPPGTITMHDFRWNEKIDPELFDASPPKGFTDVTPEPPTLEKQVADITLALRNYAELLGGRYPQAKIVYGDVTRDEMFEAIGIQRLPATLEQIRTDEYVKAVAAGLGFARLNALFRENPGFAYHGLSVGPNDKDKVLVRWRLDDGRYQVLYGDLRTESVSPERLHELEAN